MLGRQRHRRPRSGRHHESRRQAGPDGRCAARPAPSLTNAQARSRDRSERRVKRLRERTGGPSGVFDGYWGPGHFDTIGNTTTERRGTDAGPPGSVSPSTILAASHCPSADHATSSTLPAKLARSTSPPPGASVLTTPSRQAVARTPREDHAMLSIVRG